jgi:hypothetical protein
VRRDGADAAGRRGAGAGSPLDAGEPGHQGSSPGGAEGGRQPAGQDALPDDSRGQDTEPRTPRGIGPGAGRGQDTGVGSPRDTAQAQNPDQDTELGTPRDTGPRAGLEQGGGVGSSRGIARAQNPDRDSRAGGPRGGVGGRGRGAPAERRPAFQPVTIRTARDAVTAAALYLGWLGYRDIRRADQRPPSGIGLAARGILAQVDPTVRPASLRDVECLWLTAMTESADCVFFSLAGYADDARARADTLGVPLFVLDLTGTPQPVNSPADELIAVTG